MMAKQLYARGLRRRDWLVYSSSLTGVTGQQPERWNILADPHLASLRDRSTEVAYCPIVSA